jgi:uncharacterized protein
MAIEFSGTFEVKKLPEDVYDFLTNPSQFAPMLPGFESLSVQDATHCIIVVKVDFYQIKGWVEMHIELSEGERPRRGRYRGNGTAVDQNVNVAAAFELSPIAIGTNVKWTADATVSGWLAPLAELVEPLAKKHIQEFINGLLAEMP